MDEWDFLIPGTSQILLGGPAWPFLLRPAPKAGTGVVGEPVLLGLGPTVPSHGLGTHT